jgi:hypothetical protein
MSSPTLCAQDACCVREKHIAHIFAGERLAHWGPLQSDGE